MFLTTLLLSALQPGAAPVPVPTAEPHPCAPRQNLTAGGPPPPVFSAQRMEIEPRHRTYLDVDDCPGGGFRVERRTEGASEASLSEPHWVPVAQCPALRRWIEAAARLRFPPPMLTPHRDPSGRYTGTWYVLHARRIPGPGRSGNIEMHILNRPGAGPNALSLWFDEGARLFQRCRDQGHGGVGYAPYRPRLRPSAPRPPRPRP